MSNTTTHEGSDAELETARARATHQLIKVLARQLMQEALAEQPAANDNHAQEAA